MRTVHDDEDDENEDYDFENNDDNENYDYKNHETYDDSAWYISIYDMHVYSNTYTYVHHSQDKFWALIYFLKNTSFGGSLLPSSDVL